MSFTDDAWPVHEFRGVWVATVANIDWPSSSRLSTTQQKQELTAMLDQLVMLNFNAIIFQVRTSGDALYSSKLEPWSVYLTGSQGTAPNPLYDPLQFAIDETHKRGMELHAWFNPFRARVGSTQTTGLAPNHMAHRFSSACHAYGSNLWMDPGDPDVQNFTVNVVMDVVDRYDVDGIHIDDYFYPYPVSGHDFPDSDTYRRYGNHMPLHDWRRENINRLVSRLSAGIKTRKEHVKFGISPFGIWKPGHPSHIVGLNAFDEIYADSRKWLENGWVDFLTPQLYWAIDPPAQSYTALLDWWTQQNQHHRHIYAGNLAAGIITRSWSITEIERQVSESRSRRSNLSLGNIFFSAKYFVHNTHGISDVFKSQIYTSPSIAPEMTWINSTWTLPTPKNVHVTGNSVTWDEDRSSSIRSWALYRSYADGWLLTKILCKQSTTTGGLIEGTYALRAVDRLGRQGQDIIFVVGGSEQIVIG